MCGSIVTLCNETLIKRFTAIWSHHRTSGLSLHNVVKYDWWQTYDLIAKGPHRSQVTRSHSTHLQYNTVRIALM